MKKLYILCSILLFTPAYAATLHVGAGQTYTTIALAIAAASNDDTIYIHNGLYHESINSSALSGLIFEGESESGVVWTDGAVATGSPSWSKMGGYTYVYQCTASDVAGSTVQGIVDDNYSGMYQIKTSLANVDAIPGTHYTTGGVLYVHTSDGASPATHTMWYWTSGYTNLLTIGPNTTVKNITFIGGTQAAIYCLISYSTIGTQAIDNCTFHGQGCPVGTGGAAVYLRTSGGIGGTCNITNSVFTYVISPIYDSNYAVFTDSQSTLHPYQGTSMDINNFSTVNISDNIMQFSRQAIETNGCVTVNVERNLITDQCVHQHFSTHPASAVVTWQNNIFSMYGSTTGGAAGSGDGCRLNLYNNIIFTGENSVVGDSGKMFFSATDSEVETSTTVYIYNNVFVKDPDQDGNIEPLHLNGMTLTNVYMDYNYYVGTNPDAKIVRWTGETHYTLAEWQTYTDGQGHSLSDNSTQIATVAAAYLSVSDYQDTTNANFGKATVNSPFLEAATSTYAPAVDYFGTSRPQSTYDDMGAHEYVYGGGQITINGMQFYGVYGQ